MRALTALVVLVSAPSTLCAQGIVYVDADASGAGDGTSWSDAYTDLQTALAATGSGEVWVAEGLYLPGASGELEASFELRSGLALYGGFAGDELLLAERDPSEHATILSGDLDQDDTYGASWNWWQFDWTGYANNSSSIVRGDGVDASAVLDGFTIFAGSAESTAGAGAGIHLVNASPTLANLTFEKNAWGRGSALFASGGQPAVRDCVVRDGYSFGQGPSGFGFFDGCQATVEGCHFDNHYVVTTFGQGRGGGLHVDLSSRATVRSCRFTGCQTGNWFAQGDPSGSYGAGIHNRGQGLVVESSVFEDGFSHWGSGIYTSRDATIVNCLFRENRVVGYPVEKWLDYGDAGAGVGIIGSGPVRIEGCTFVDNDGDKGALSCQAATTTIVRNSILWGNTGPAALPGEDPVWPLKRQITGDYDLGWSNVEYLLQTEPGEDPPDPEAFPGCIDADPLFAFTGFDPRLAPGSPCIDAGNTFEVSGGIALDLDGAPRLADDPATSDTGVGGPPVVDMGAYEFAGPQTLLASDREQLALASGGTQSFQLSAGPAQAGALHFLLGSSNGSTPGIPVDGVLFPLNPFGSYFQLTLLHPNSALHPSTLGALDADGRATAGLVLPPGTNPGLAGLVLTHAYVVLDTSGSLSVTTASNAVDLLLVP